MTFTNARDPGPGMEQAPVDVCKTPDPVLQIPVPTPYVNIGMRVQAIPSYFTVLLNHAPMLTVMAQIPTSIGDDAGIRGGVVSQTFKGPVTYLMGSTVFFVNGAPVTRNTDPTMHNAGNAPGTGAAPSQVGHMVAV